MENQFLRTEMVLGADGMDALRRSHVAVFGLGGVGSYAVEALVRSGVGELTLIDDDTVALTNLNRQLEALHSTLGQSKVEAIAARCRDINPAVILHPIVHAASPFSPRSARATSSTPRSFRSRTSPRPTAARSRA